MIERDLLGWLEIFEGAEAPPGQESPLDVWERRWSERLRDPLREATLRARLTGEPAPLDLSPAALGYLACRLVAVRRAVRLLVAASQPPEVDGGLLGTLPRTWEAVWSAVTPGTPYPALLPPRPLAGVALAGLRGASAETLVVAPIGRLVDLYERARRGLSHPDPARQSQDRALLASLRLTLTDDVVERFV